MSLTHLMHISTVPLAGLLAASLIGSALGTPLGAQGAVTGQVSIVEHVGDKTDDLGNTVLYLDAQGVIAPGAKKAAPVTKSDPLSARNFSTHVMVVPQGSKISFPNQDPWSHNVFTKAPQGGFDTDLYGHGKTKDNVFKEAGVYPLYCNIHPRMTAFVIAVKTPYYTQAGADGRFSIPAVPAGKYALHVWHERGGEQVDTLEVPATGLARNIHLDASKYKYVQHKDKNGKDYVYAGDVY